MCHFADMLEINFGLKAKQNNVAVCFDKIFNILLVFHNNHKFLNLNQTTL